MIFAASAALSLLAAVSATDLPTGWWPIQPGEKVEASTFHGSPRYLTWMADSQIKHGVAPTHAYTQSAFYSGVMRAYERTNDTRYLDYVKHKTDIVLYPAWNGEDILLYNDSQSIDDIRFGHTFLDMYEATGDDIYRTAADVLKAQIDRSKRTPDGGFYHRFPVYMDQMWLDGIYMLDVYYARHTAAFDADNSTAWDDIALQFDLIDAGTTVARNRTAGLPVHGFDVSKTAVWADPDTGAAPHVWARGVGWYVMALVDTIELFPASHAGRARMVGYLRSLADAVVKAQDGETRGWWNVMTPGTEGAWGNYVESSGSAMFVYGLLKGLRLGLLEGEAYLTAALDGYKLMTETFAVPREGDGALTWQWTVQTGSLSSNGTFEYYASQPLYENDLKGVAPFLFSSYEYELYLENNGSC